MNKYHNLVSSKSKTRSSSDDEPRWVTRCLEYKQIDRKEEIVNKNENSFSKFFSNLIPRREKERKPPKKPPRKGGQLGTVNHFRQTNKPTIPSIFLTILFFLSQVCKMIPSCMACRQRATESH